MLKEKAAFLQKHDQALFGKDFRDHLTESLKAKKQSIEAITEVSKSTNRKRPFREGPLFYQGRPNGGGGGQKSRLNYNGKYILFQKKGTPSQQQPNFTSSCDKHGVFNSCSSNTKKIIAQTKNSREEFALAGRIKEVLPAWKLLKKNQEFLALVGGYQIPLLMEPVQEKAPKVLKLN